MKDRFGMRMITACVLISCISGCNATHLVYVHNANLGVDVSYSPEGSAKLAIGYDRETFALVPRRDPKAPGSSQPGNGEGDAMSLASMSSVSIAALNDVKFDHLVATGGPAIRIAQAAAQGGPKFKYLADAAFGPQPEPSSTGSKKDPKKSPPGNTGGSGGGAGTVPGAEPPPAPTPAPAPAPAAPGNGGSQ